MLIENVLNARHTYKNKIRAKQSISTFLCSKKNKIQEAKKNIKNMRKASESQTMLKIAIALSHPPPPPSLPSLLNNNNDENQVNLKMSEKFVS